MACQRRSERSSTSSVEKGTLEMAGRTGGMDGTSTESSPLELERRSECGMPSSMRDVSLRSLLMKRSAWSTEYRRTC